MAALHRVSQHETVTVQIAWEVPFTALVQLLETSMQSLCYLGLVCVYVVIGVSRISNCLIAGRGCGQGFRVGGNLSSISESESWLTIFPAGPSFLPSLLCLGNSPLQAP
jgi:hypothetical protein